MSGSIQGGQYSDGRMMRQVDERDEDMGMDEYGVSYTFFSFPFKWSGSSF